MAKRRLGVPQVPPGPQYDFFALMQDFVLRCGDKSLATMSNEMNRSRQSLHRALRGPDLPSRDLVEHIVKTLFAGNDEERAPAVDRALTAWTEAVSDRTQRERGHGTQDREPLNRYRAALAQFSEALREAHSQAGRPAISMIEHRARQMRHPANISRSAVSDWMRGKALPSSYDRVRDLVTVMFVDQPDRARWHLERLVRLHEQASDARWNQGKQT
ncbi:hypothetical protein [Streptomyces herbicida]|uniref:hypothetical protein n=1 Tax=Streptomyces herbicida TaxID=3065675 RepID=UPI00292F8098|nr:hypothetical protein [Streptomyces sp. NEAU-HV9]